MSRRLQSVLFVYHVLNDIFISQIGSLYEFLYICIRLQFYKSFRLFRSSDSNTDIFDTQINLRMIYFDLLLLVVNCYISLDRFEKRRLKVICNKMQMYIVSIFRMFPNRIISNFCQNCKFLFSIFPTRITIWQ